MVRYKKQLIKRYGQKMKLIARKVNQHYIQRAVLNRQKINNTLDGRSEKEIRAEGQQISNLVAMGSVVPEREDLAFYIITIGWWKRWQKYTGCFQLDPEEQDLDPREEIA